MKKSILPAIIILLSIYFINTFIDKKGEDVEKIVAKNMPVPVITSGNQTVKPVLLFEGEGKVTKALVDKAVKKAPAIKVDPYGEAVFNIPDKESRITLSEWDLKNGKEIKQFDENYISGMANEHGTRIILIRSETEESSAVYVGKINMLKQYSYQELLNPARNIYTILIFKEGEPGIREVPSDNENKYVTREIRASISELRKRYPDLEFKSLPAIYVFHQGFIIFKSQDMRELQTFITDMETMVFRGESENWQVEFKARQNLTEGDAELTVTYKGIGPMPKSVDFGLSGRGWSWGSGGSKLDDSGKIFISNEMRFKLSENDSIPVELTWDGKSEEIILAYRKDR
ncbi:hypothetical protein [Bacillus sp. FJAT-27445]|uniref:hypothetical protein n=1 Tax=Bacillus sp. FJAT-27445 TaxID=1679166 RepID=UPI0007432BFF|nr:hypothetical protein [Bacillus sp. FJAT-27445]